MASGGGLGNMRCERLPHADREPRMSRPFLRFVIPTILVFSLQGCGEKKQEAAEQPARGLRAYEIAAKAGGRRTNATQSQQRLHNYQPTATDGRCGNSTIPYQFINFGPPETCRLPKSVISTNKKQPAFERAVPCLAGAPKPAGAVAGPPGSFFGLTGSQVRVCR